VLFGELIKSIREKLNCFGGFLYILIVFLKLIFSQLMFRLICDNTPVYMAPFFHSTCIYLWFLLFYIVLAEITAFSKNTPHFLLSFAHISTRFLVFG
jgi:hypothetical protein